MSESCLNIVIIYHLLLLLPLFLPLERKIYNKKKLSVIFSTNWKNPNSVGRGYSVRVLRSQNQSDIETY